MSLINMAVEGGSVPMPESPRSAPAEQSSEDKMQWRRNEQGRLICPDAKCPTTYKGDDLRGMQRHVVVGHLDIRDQWVPYYCLTCKPKVGVFVDAAGLKAHKCGSGSKRGYDTKESVRKETLAAKRAKVAKPEHNFKLDDCCKADWDNTTLHRHRADVHKDGLCQCQRQFLSFRRSLLWTISMSVLSVGIFPSLLPEESHRYGSQLRSGKKTRSATYLDHRRAAVLVGQIRTLTHARLIED